MRVTQKVIKLGTLKFTRLNRYLIGKVNSHYRDRMITVQQKETQTFQKRYKSADTGPCLNRRRGEKTRGRTKKSVLSRASRAARASRRIATLRPRGKESFVRQFNTFPRGKRARPAPPHPARAAARRTMPNHKYKTPPAPPDWARSRSEQGVAAGRGGAGWQTDGRAQGPERRPARADLISQLRRGVGLREALPGCARLSGSRCPCAWSAATSWRRSCCRPGTGTS